MSVEIKAPTFPESVQDGTVATWHVSEGDTVKRDAPLVDIETDKVVMEVVAPADGIVEKILKKKGDVVESNEVIGKISASESGSGKSAGTKSGDSADKSGEATPSDSDRDSDEPESAGSASGAPKVNPAAQRLLDEKGIEASAVTGTGRGGRVTKADVVNYLETDAGSMATGDESATPVAAATPTLDAAELEPAGRSQREEKRVPMSRLRSRIAERLVLVSQNTAMLTTFNEVDMQSVMDLRKRYQASFERSHGVRLGFMSLFVKAATEALKRFPAVNASIDGDEIVYRGYQDIGVAVSTERGLMVPILRDTAQLGLADIEKKIAAFADKARSGQIGLEDITGGTFTISNGGVYGSLLSTPLLNPPQTAILGMHKIQDRPVAIDGQVVVRPMMYLALSYDHRLIDGKEAVEFLVAIKEMIEDPAKILLEI